MAKVAVGLWTRDTHDYSIPMKDTLRDLERVVARTREWAMQNALAPQAGKLRSIFVAPEFLFTRKREADDHSGTTAISKYERDVALARIHEIAKASPSMLLVPGTIVFGESLESAHDAWVDKNQPDLMHPFAKASRNLAQAANPAPINDQGKNWDYVKKQMKPANQLARLTRKAYPTKEIHEDQQHDAGYKARYTTQMTELTEAEQLMVLGDSSKIESHFFVKNRTYVFFDKEKVFSYGKKTNMGDYDGDEAKGIWIPGRKEGITTIDGLKIGFEICFDHNFGTLADHMGSTGKNLDLHIICSAEVPNEQARCMAKPDGYLLHASTGAGNQEHTAVYKQGKGINWTKIDSQPVGGNFGGHLRLYVIDVGA